MLLRHYLEQGVSKSALARRLGISRDTIHRWIRDGDLDRDLDAGPVAYGPRPVVPTKLDAFNAIIETRLEAYPDLSAVQLLEEIRAAGYDGGYTQLKEFVRQVRPHPCRSRSSGSRRLRVGRPRWTLPASACVGREVRSSRGAGLLASAVAALPSAADMRTLLLGLEDAFAFFGGVPQELLFVGVAAAGFERLRRKVRYDFQNAALVDSMRLPEDVAQGIPEDELNGMGRPQLVTRVADALPFARVLRSGLALHQHGGGLTGMRPIKPSVVVRGGRDADCG